MTFWPPSKSNPNTWIGEQVDPWCHDLLSREARGSNLRKRDGGVSGWGHEDGRVVKHGNIAKNWLHILPPILTLGTKVKGVGFSAPHISNTSVDINMLYVASTGAKHIMSVPTSIEMLLAAGLWYASPSCQYFQKWCFGDGWKYCAI